MRWLPLLLLLPVGTGGATGSLLPEPGELPGWTLQGEAKVLDQANLWQHINGADQQFIQYGCVDLTVAYLQDASGEREITIEAYRMADLEGSFGVYALEKPSGAASLELGGEGYEEPGGFTFYAGSHYVKLRAMPVERSAEVLRRLARGMAGKAPEGPRRPRACDLFPRQGMVEGSLGFAPAGILGTRELRRALTARYGAPGHEMTLHLLQEPDDGAAAAKLEGARASLAKRAPDGLSATSLEGARGVRGKLPYSGGILLLQQGRNLVLITGIEGQAAADDLARALLAALPGAGS